MIIETKAIGIFNLRKNVWFLQYELSLPIAIFYNENLGYDLNTVHFLYRPFIIEIKISM